MSILSNLLANLGFQAAAGQLPPLPLPRAPSRAVALPSFKTQVARQEGALQRRDRQLANTDITTFRQGADSRTVLREFVNASPDLSATKSSYLRLGIPEDYTVVARDMDGAINLDATKMAQEILRRLTFLGDPTLGYNPVTDLQSLSEALGQEAVLYGGMGLELALDKQRLPTYLQAVSLTKLVFKEEDGGVYPVQVVGGEERSLDIPTFFYVSIDQDLTIAYSTSYFEPALQAVIADAQFLNDLRRSMVRSLQPRIIASIVEDKVKASMPPDVLNDPEKLAAAYGTILSTVTAAITSAQPEDAFVTMDAVDYKYMGGSGDSMKAFSDNLLTVQKILESKVAAGAKSMPAVLGRDDSAGSATTSTMLFLKSVDIIRRKLNLLYSRALSTAVRLQGMDCYVEFRYADIDLRPKGELEAYKSMEQSRLLEQLSLGLITDEEACIRLTGNLPPQGYVPKSGTMFRANQVPAGAIANPNSQTSTMFQPSTPAQPKGNPNA